MNSLNYFIAKGKFDELSGKKPKGSAPSYHSNKSCKGFHKVETVPVSQQFVVDHNLKPCKVCFPEFKSQTPSAVFDSPALPIETSSTFPTKTLIPIWTCSDGREWSSEVEALRWELDLCQCRQKERKANGCSHLKEEGK